MLRLFKCCSNSSNLDLFQCLHLRLVCRRTSDQARYGSQLNAAVAQCLPVLVKATLIVLCSQLCVALFCFMWPVVFSVVLFVVVWKACSGHSTARRPQPRQGLRWGRLMSTESSEERCFLPELPISGTESRFSVQLAPVCCFPKGEGGSGRGSDEKWLLITSYWRRQGEHNGHFNTVCCHLLLCFLFASVLVLLWFFVQQPLSSSRFTTGFKQTTS